MSAVVDFRSLAEMFLRLAAERDDRVRYRTKRGGEWREVSWREHEQTVLEIASGLVASDVAPGTKVAILAGTRAEWMEIDFAVYLAGGVTIPIYPSNLAKECGYILWNSESAFAFTENEAQTAKIREVAERGFDHEGAVHRTPLRGVFQIDGDPSVPGVGTLAALRELGRARLSELRPEIDRRVSALGRDTVATIVYTSGTTGPPKGVVQTHGNHLAALAALEQVALVQPGDVDFLFLPLAHSFARFAGYFSTAFGLETAFAQSIDTVPQDIRETRPHFVPSVPRIFEKVYARIQSVRAQSSGVRRAIFDWAVALGRERSRHDQAGTPVPALVRLQLALADRLVLAKIREQLGGRIRVMVSGGAPLAREIQEFFHAVGILVLEGYGLTETTPILTASTPEAYRLGTVGRAIPGVTLRIAEDGEILAKGPNVAQGYYKRPEATAEAWDEDGWFHTGDIGEISEDGFVRITDRKKDLLKTSGGKYVAPQTIENLLKTQPHVSQAVVVGDNRKYCTVLVTLDVDEVRRWAKTQGIAEQDPEALARHPAVVKLIDGEIAAVNRHLASYESLKYFRIVPRDFSQETGELTPSLKVKRKVVGEKYADLIEEMYR